MHQYRVQQEQQIFLIFKEELMRIAVVGTGGVGGYFGGRLARTEQDVVFLARGAHLRAIQEHGLQVESVDGDFAIRPAHATDNPARIGPVDLVLLAVMGEAAVHWAIWWGGS